MQSQVWETIASDLQATAQQSDWRSYEGPRFEVHSVTRRLGAWYEKLRYTVDFQEDHALRQMAIARLIERHRLLHTNGSPGQQLLVSLVQAGYIESGVLPEAIVPEIDRDLAPFQQLAAARAVSGAQLAGYAAVVIERRLFPNASPTAVVRACYMRISEYVKQAPSSTLDEREFLWLLYVAVRRRCLIETPGSLRLALHQLFAPTWTEEQGDAGAFAQAFLAREAQIDHLLAHSALPRIERRLHDEGIYAQLLGSITEQYGPVLSAGAGDEGVLSRFVTDELEQTYATLREKIPQIGWRALWYILITKIIIGLAIEVPYEWYFLGELHYFSLAINVITFPVLLWLSIKTLSYPGDTDLAATTQGFWRFVSGDTIDPVYIKTNPPSLAGRIGFSIYSLLFTAVVCGGVAYGLAQLGFTIVSIVLFVFFGMIVLFTNWRLRHRVAVWQLERTDEPLWLLLWYICIAPVTRAGRYLSEKLARTNVFIYFFDFVLETPFRYLLGSFDDFVTFLQDTKRQGL